MSSKEIKIKNSEGTLVTKVVSESTDSTPFFLINFFCHRLSGQKKLGEKNE